MKKLAFILLLIFACPVIPCKIVIAMRGDVDINPIGYGEIEYSVNDGYFVEINSKKYPVSTYITMFGPCRWFIGKKQIGLHASVFTSSKFKGNQAVLWGFIDRKDILFVQKEMNLWTFEFLSFPSTWWIIWLLGLGGGIILLKMSK